MSEAVTVTGGCQCGAMRYAITTPLENPHICHCRMCQKAFGNYFAAYVATAKSGFRWTKGQPAFFRSSPIAARSFCRDCGTPLSIADDDSDRIEISIGSLDHPEAVKPLHQSGIESRLPAFGELHALPGSRTDENIPPERVELYRSLQHPDRD